MRSKYVRRVPAICLAAFVLLLGGTVSASVIYEYATDQPSYEVEPGGTALVQIFLVETVDGGSTSELVGQNGLFSFDLAVDVTVAPSDPATVIASQANPEFNGVVNNVPPEVVIADRDFMVESDGVQAVLVDPNTRHILLTTLTIQAGTTVGEVTIFSVANFENPATPGTDSNTYLWDDTLAQTPLDELISPAEFSVTTVPEPSAMVLLIFGLLGLLSWHLARSRRQANSTATSPAYRSPSSPPFSR